MTLFAPPWGPKPGLDTPAYLFASDPESDGSDTDDAGPSQRPYTLTPLAAKLGLTIDIHDKKATTTRWSPRRWTERARC